MASALEAFSLGTPVVLCWFTCDSRMAAGVAGAAGGEWNCECEDSTGTAAASLGSVHCAGTRAEIMARMR